MKKIIFTAFISMALAFNGFSQTQNSKEEQKQKITETTKNTGTVEKESSLFGKVKSIFNKSLDLYDKMLDDILEEMEEEK